MVAFRNATELEIRDYLTKKGMQLKDAPSGNFVCKNCPNCEKVNPAQGKSDNLWKLYVLKDGGAFKCHRCSWKGSWYEMKDYFGDNPIKVAPVVEGKKREYNKPEEGKFAEYVKSDDRKDVIEYAEKRGIKKETLDYFDIGCRKSFMNGENLTFVTFPFQRLSLKNFEIETLMFKHRCISDKSKMFIEPAGAEMFLFGQQLVPVDSKEIVVTEGECLTGDAEVLTPEGWVRLDQYSGQKVVQVEQGKASLVKPIAYVMKPYVGDICNFKTRGLSFTCTPEHGVALINSTSRKKKGEWYKKPFNEIKSSEHQIPRVANLDGSGLPLTNDQIAFCIAMSADFKFDYNKNGTIRAHGCFKKERKKERLIGILERLGLKFTSYKQLKDGLDSFNIIIPSWCPGRFFPHDWITKMSSEQREFFISELTYWDGNFVPNRNQTEYSSKYIENAKFVQSIAHLSGRCSTIMHRENDFGKWLKVSILNSKKTSSTQKIEEKTTRTHFDGTVYCVQVPSGMFICRQHESIFVTGNCDAMSVWQETKFPVVSLPNGANSLPELAIKYFKRFDKIYLALDDDAPGREAAEKIAQKVGREKCVLVRWRDGLDEGAKDANEYLMQGENLLEKIMSATPMPHDKISTQLEVKNDLKNWLSNPLKNHGYQLKDSDLVEMNSLLGGFRPGELTVLTARPGIGKSTCASQITLDLASQGVRILWGSFEIDSFHILRKMMQQRVKKEITAGPGGNVDAAYDEVKDHQVWYLKHHGQTKSEDILNAMEYAVKALGVEFIVIDNLQFIVGDHDGQAKFDQQNRVLTMLRDFKKIHNVHILLIAHTTKVDDSRSIQLGNLFGTSKMGQEIDNAIAIQTHEPSKYVETIKNRLHGSTGESGGRKRFYYSYDPKTERISKTTVWAGDVAPIQKAKTQWSGKKEAPKTFGADRALNENDKPF